MLMALIQSGYWDRKVRLLILTLVTYAALC